MNIQMKAESFIGIFRDNDYEKTDIKVYQHLIKKLIYLFYGTKLNIAFAVRQLSK